MNTLTTNLADLEQALKDAKKQLSAKEKKRAAQPAADAAKDAAFLAQPASFAEPAFSLQPVFDYLDHLKKEPREILEARHAALIGLPAPAEARHEWLVHRVAYHFQIKHYQSHFGEWKVPRSVLDNNHNHALSFSGPYSGKAYDADDPSFAADNVEIWDDTYVVACAPNPYAKGDARKAFFCVEIAGPGGVGFAPLCKTLEEMLETSVGDAQRAAYDLFTKKVREGLTRIVIK